MDDKSWQEYHILLAKQRVPQKAQEWYMRWAKNFDKALPDVPLSERVAGEVQSYINSLIKRGKCQDWQISQANDTLRLLFGEYLALPWAQTWPVIFGESKNEKNLYPPWGCQFILLCIRNGWEIHFSRKGATDAKFF